MTFLIIAGVLLLVFFGVGGYLFHRACARVPDLPWLDREAILKTNYAPHADLIQRSQKWLLDHEAKDVWTKSEDGLKLHGLWVEAEDAVGTAVLVHGYHSTKLVDFGGSMAYFHRQGLNLLLVDQRSHGESEGRYVTFGVKESRDMLCWLHYLEQELWKGPVILSGLSMGASTVMFMADEDLPTNVKGLLVDCGFTSPADILGKVFRDVTHLPPVPWIWAAELFARSLAGFSLWEKSSIKSLSKNRLPILMAHGKADDFVPCAMTEVAYEACGGDKMIHLVEGAGHGLSFLVDKKGYASAVRSTLIKALGEPYELRADKEQ